MLPRLQDQVVVVGGGAAGAGIAVTRALLLAGARVVVPVDTDEAAERFYLDADPETVPHLRTASGAADDPATLARIAAVARREFGGIDHLVAVFPPPAAGWLNALDAEAAHAALRGACGAPGLFVLGLLRHLNGSAAAVKRVVMIAAAPRAGGRPDAVALGRVFAEGLVSLLGGGARPGTEFAVLTSAALADPQAGDPELTGRAAAWVLAEGAAAGVIDERSAAR